MKFDKTMSDQIEFISLALENCENLEVFGDDILDFWTSEIRMGVGSYGENEADDGGIVISKRAFKNMSSAATEEYEDGTRGLDYDPEEVFYLYNRLMKCCDICQIFVKLKDGGELLFSVPYDPLESDLCGNEIDLSNCPSAELDANGDLSIFFGASSHTYQRTDNNYFDLVIGLKDEIKHKLNGPLQIWIDTFSNTKSDYRCPRLFIGMRIANHGYSGKKMNLVFEDIKNVTYDISFGEEEKRHLWMSRISNGEIFVEIEGFCTFYCQGIKTYSHFSGERDDSGIYEENEIYKKTLRCELSERQMELFAGNHLAHNEKEFDMTAFTDAVQKVLNGDITVKYFMNWLNAHSEMVQFYSEVHFRNDAFYCTLATMMDRLQIKLSYYENLSDCRALIEKSAEEIEEFYKAEYVID